MDEFLPTSRLRVYVFRYSRAHCGCGMRALMGLMRDDEFLCLCLTIVVV